MSASPDITNNCSIRPRTSTRTAQHSVARQALVYSTLLAASTVAAISMMLNLAP